MRETRRIQTVVIGAGQAGLSVGYHLATNLGSISSV
jgi:cation diffusion facilitator CzcD-associated flavoprotein CzcO